MKYEYDVFAHAPNQLEIERLEAEVDRLTLAVSGAETRGKYQGRAAAEADFAQKTLDYSQGCDSGKVDFLEYCGLDEYLPSAELYVTFRVSIDTATDERVSDAEYDITNQISSMYGDYFGDPWDIGVERM